MSGIDIAKVRGTKSGVPVRSLQMTEDGKAIYGERQSGTAWIADCWCVNGAWSMGDSTTPLDLIESPVAAEPAEKCPSCHGFGVVTHANFGSSMCKDCGGKGWMKPQPQKPKAITRYDVNRTNSSMDAYPDGDWVSYQDHIAAFTHRDADVGREELADMIRAALDFTAPENTWYAADAILAKFHIAKKG